MAGCTTLANARPRRVLQRVDPAHTLGAHRFPPDVYFTNLKQPSGTSEVAVRPSSQGCTGLSNGKTSVLVVEDEFLIRLNAVSIVEDCGFEAVEASNADQAIRILEADTNIRLVFTDIDMPGTMDGLKLAHYIGSGGHPSCCCSLRGRPSSRRHNCRRGRSSSPSRIATTQSPRPSRR